MSSTVLLLATFIEGAWVSRKIEESAKFDAAVATTTFIDILIATQFRSFAQGSQLSATQIKTLDDVIERAGSTFGGGITGKIWTPDGKIVYATQKELIGQKFTPDAAILSAASGKVAVEFEEDRQSETLRDQSDSPSLLEIWAPIHHDGKVIVIAEIYGPSAPLKQAIAAAKWEALQASLCVHGAIVFALFWIVAQGSATISQQRATLEERLRQNEQLRWRVEEAAQHATEDNQRFLRRLGADLHDGPAQLIGLALLRLDALRPLKDTKEHSAPPEEEVAAIRMALADAMKDIRALCAGLSMPEIEDASLEEALAQGISDHERRTRTTVRFQTRNLPEQVPHFVKICLSRFIQEGLNNAFKHAGGKGQKVAAWAEEDTITVEVEDEGPGFDPSDYRLRAPSGLGLKGLRDRIESLGGMLVIGRMPRMGTRLSAILPVKYGEL
ncbi:sensor histidine kinase [Microvirga sp. BT689]|uniref:sensor histidine kinase n=1 Tax=Microvirga arvi TaxID=2778731 RepID=UPI0019523B7B|nr:sensor histidine kinase [Microvirga arvi]MBM6584375.1 sensor histidine kinase [Microvirga arvi]